MPKISVGGGEYNSGRVIGLPSRAVAAAAEISSQGRTDGNVAPLRRRETMPCYSEDGHGRLVDAVALVELVGLVGLARRERARFRLVLCKGEQKAKDKESNLGLLSVVLW